MKGAPSNTLKLFFRKIFLKNPETNESTLDYFVVHQNFHGENLQTFGIQIIFVSVYLQQIFLEGGGGTWPPLIHGVRVDFASLV